MPLIRDRVELARRGNNPMVICRLPSGWAVVGDVQFLPGYSLLLADPVVPSLNDLDAAQRVQFLADMTRLGDAILQVTGCERINYEILGNSEPKLHAHIFPRYAAEPEELRRMPAWFYDWEDAPRFDEQAHGQLRDSLRLALLGSLPPLRPSSGLRNGDTVRVRHEEVGETLDYLYWVRDRILSAAAGLTDDEFRLDETVTTRSLRATLVHQMECEWAWRIRLTYGSFPDKGLSAEAYENLPALVARWRREERDLRAWFAGLSEADLAAVPPQRSSPLSRWRHLLYLVNHGTQQFAEAAVLLTRLGHSPGEIGYLAFCLRDEAGRSASSQI